ncbi:hypothetical protein TL16_g06788 [Triparma laevis f. inornata]|uniref:Uncharacterized protein n=1 Tax=Triparma laevis f. inornata TaxID=1714386 RepID=A0A9W7EG94_9STRA|nr:hypothetical protein TL16_g06788 [Triparma laevis f. inornata]
MQAGGGGLTRTITDSTGPLHSYNTLLAMVHLREHCDAVILKGNGDLLNDVMPNGGGSGGGGGVTMADVNDRVGETRRCGLSAA